MITYRIDEHGFHSGETGVTDGKGASPQGWTRQIPPNCPTGQRPRWIDGWTCSTATPSDFTTGVTWTLDDIYLVDSASSFVNTQNIVAQMELRGQV